MYKAFSNAFMIVAAVLVPINIWTAIVPHLHDFTAMRLLHLVSSAVFALALGLLANNCPITKNKCAPLVKVVGVTYGLFLLIMIIVNVNIARTGMVLHVLRRRLLVLHSQQHCYYGQIIKHR